MANGYESVKKLHNVGTGGDKPISCYSASSKVLATTMDGLTAFRTSEGEMDYYNPLTQLQPTGNISNIRFKKNSVEYAVTKESRITTSHTYMYSGTFAGANATYPANYTSGSDASYNGPTSPITGGSRSYNSVNVYSSVCSISGLSSGGYQGTPFNLVLEIIPSGSPNVLYGSGFTFFSWTRVSTSPSGATVTPSAGSGSLVGAEFVLFSSTKGYYLLNFSPGVYNFTFNYTSSGYGSYYCQGFLAQ